MKRIRTLLEFMLKIDKSITAGEFAKILNGKPIKIDLMA